MNPTDQNSSPPTPPDNQPNPASYPASQPNVAGEVPVFRNPLAQGYEDHTSQLPAMSVQPTTLPSPQPAPAPSPINPSSPPEPSPPVASPPVPPNEAAAPPPASQPVEPVSAQPKVSQLSASFVQPAPVRLAPVPRSDDIHAGGLQAASQATPFNTLPENTPPRPAAAPMAVPAQKKTKSIGVIIGVASGVVVLILGIIGFYAYQTMRNKTNTVQTNAPSKAESVRDKTEKPTQPFSEKITTDCYVAQSLTPVETQQNKDCDLSINYGEQKTSSIFVSALSEFDVVTDGGDEQSSQNSSSEIDTNKYLDALIADIIDKELVTVRETTQVGNLEATKVVGKKDASSTVDVAYTFIILPEGDMIFGEKKFIAFTVTGAYNDDYSRKGYDQFLSTWSWK